nr:MAG TPA: hypothetical protein [Caudoviricetes sp.]
MKAYKQFLREKDFPDCKEVKAMYRCWWIEKHSEMIWKAVSMILSIIAAVIASIVTVRLTLR